MPRRESYIKVKRENFLSAPHVTGMGDRVFRGFQCLNKNCTNWILVREDQFGDWSDVEIVCEKCQYRHAAGESAILYDYTLTDRRTETSLEAGKFEILHDDYLRESERFKYCIVCGALKPLTKFDRHASRVSGRQGECSLCKQVYNSIKNQTRLVEQHREASQRRRLYTQFGDQPKLNISVIYEKFGGKCFKCDVDLSSDLIGDTLESRIGNLDHTLPVFFLWPMTTANATLLCRDHNGEKAEKWPSQFYNDAELRRLSRLTALDYRLLRNGPIFNPDALRTLTDHAFVEALFEKFAAYPDELLRLRNRVMAAEGFDFLAGVPGISPDWIQRADSMLR
jgi:hypothetical protein